MCAICRVVEVPGEMMACKGCITLPDMEDEILLDDVFEEVHVARHDNNSLMSTHTDIGVATWNIHDLTDPQAKIGAIHRIFEENDWLDVLALQEVRKGHLEALAEVCNATLTSKSIGGKSFQLALHLGPFIIGLTPQNAPKKQQKNDPRKVGTYQYKEKTRALWVMHKQNEYYPVIVRKRPGLKVKGSAAFVRDWTHADPIYWSKPLEKRKGQSKFSEEKRARIRALNELYPPYRPVVIHALSVDDHDVNIAVVHTTPLGQNLGRQGEYEQVEAFFGAIGGDQNAHWIAAGDYYLDPESSVKHSSSGTGRVPADYFSTAVDKMGLTLVVSISATNQSVILGETVPRKDWTLGAGGKVVVNKRADFIVASKRFSKHEVGLIAPGGRLQSVDPNHALLSYWRSLSDHCPAGAVFCLGGKMKRHCAVSSVHDEKVDPQALFQASQKLFQMHGEALRNLCSAFQTLAHGLAVYKKWSEHAPLVARTCVYVFHVIMDVGPSFGVTVEAVPEDFPSWAEKTDEISDDALDAFLDQQCSIFFGERQKQLGGQDSALSEQPLSDGMSLAMLCAQIRSHLHVLEYSIGDFDPVDERDPVEEDEEPSSEDF